MRTEELKIYKIAQKIAKIAEGETKESLSTEIVKLTLLIQTGKTVYIKYNKENKLIYSTLCETKKAYDLDEEYELIMTIEKSKELNKYKITYV